MNFSDFLPFRQIHLDFHTSEQIPGVGADFDPDEFAETLVKAHVNSITCFARCHHGMIYYPSKINPERVHPHLHGNLLKAQIDACHKRGIRAPIYTTVQWDYYSATDHPEWLLADENGKFVGTPPFEAGFYRYMNVNSPYVDFLKAHVQEMFEMLDVDGFFFDIVQPIPSSDRYTQEKMRATKLDPANADHRQQFALDSLNDFKREMSAFVRQFSKTCSIFYNAGHVGTRHRQVADAYTHWELETLPSGGWGYLHFPVSMRYARNVGNVDVLGQTGKFHTSWGDFHSFKSLPALQYEVFRMLALGAKCMIGDQLHPRGRIDPHVYDLVGKVYAEVAQKEAWVKGARGISEIALFTPEEFSGASAGTLPNTIKGATRMLEEAAYQFEIVDSQSDLSRYKLLILPDSIPVSAEFANKLEAYLAAGGALIATFESGLNEEKSDFALKSLGVRKTGDGPRDARGEWVRGRNFRSGDYVDYILPQGQIGAGMPVTEHVMYLRGLDVAVQAGSTVLAQRINPYFDRTWEHFCSHRQTPSSGQTGAPAIVQNGRAIYFSHPIFSQYFQNAPHWVKRMMLNAIQMLLPNPLIQHNGPSTLYATLSQQAQENRHVVHLLHYIPERRGADFDVVEDVIPLYNLKVSVRVEQPIRSVQAVPEGKSLQFTQQGGRVEFELPKLHGHQMVELA